MNELVTIVVPVYNVSIYLERCINSIRAQTYSNLQIILIDDGSTDGSGDMCDVFEREDARIEVIHQDNAGISAARNAGLGLALGTWISFVDSDDYISHHFVEDLLSAAQDDCDIIISRYVSVKNSAQDTDATFRRLSHTQHITGYEASIRHFGKDADLLNLSCCKLIRSHLFKTLRYPDGKLNEDLYVSHMMLYSAKQIVITDSILYAYVQSSDSIMRKSFSIRNLDVVDAWQEAVQVFNTKNDPDLLHIARRVYCCRLFDAMCICKRELPHEHEALASLRRRAKQAYCEAKPIRGYIDCSGNKVFAHKLKLLLGRRCLPLYNLIFIRKRAYI